MPIKGNQISSIPTQSTTISMVGSNHFTNGQLNVERIGDTVTLSWGVLAHSNRSIVTSAANLIPEWARPTTNQYNQFHFSSSSGFIVECKIITNGTFVLNYLAHDGSSASSNSSEGGGSISYRV